MLFLLCYEELYAQSLSNQSTTTFVSPISVLNDHYHGKEPVIEKDIREDCSGDFKRLLISASQVCTNYLFLIGDRWPSGYSI